MRAARGDGGFQRQVPVDEEQSEQFEAVAVSHQDDGAYSLRIRMSGRLVDVNHYRPQNDAEKQLLELSVGRGEPFLVDVESGAIITRIRAGAIRKP